MAQFIGCYAPGGRMVYIRCSTIERVESPDTLEAEEKAPPNKPITLVLRGTDEVLQVYACSVADILNGIGRDDCFLDRFRDETGP